MTLYERILAVCPIISISKPDRLDARTYRLQFADAATPQQRAAARAILDAFDPVAEEAKEQKRQQLAATDGPFVRVLEDLLAALVAKGTIALSDLPASARAKLAARQALRAEIGE
jgi:hypothetical protein